MRSIGEVVRRIDVVLIGIALRVVVDGTDIDFNIFKNSLEIGLCTLYIDLNGLKVDL